MINIVEYTFHKFSGFIGIKNRATPNRDPAQAKCKQKPFHNRLLISLKVVVERLYCMKDLYIHKRNNICQDINMLCGMWLKRALTCRKTVIIPNGLRSLTILFNFEIQTYDSKIVAFNLKQRKACVKIQ